MDFILRTWHKSDIDSVAKYANNKKIADNLRNAFPWPYTYEDARGYVTSCIEAGETRQCTRAIDVDGEAVGSIGIFLEEDVYCKTLRSATGWQSPSGAAASCLPPSASSQRMLLSIMTWRVSTPSPLPTTRGPAERWRRLATHWRGSLKTASLKILKFLTAASTLLHADLAICLLTGV